MENLEMSVDHASAGKGPNWVRIALVAALLIGALLLWRHMQEQRKREATLGAMVSAFQEQNKLSVFRAQVPSFVTSRHDGWIFDAEQSGVIPASVEYHLDLSKLTEQNFEWDRDRSVMTVTMPPLVISEPVLDMQRAKLVNRGILVSGNVGVDLVKQNAGVAKRQAYAEAQNPQMMALARDAARKAMTQNISVPLQAAGFNDVKVVARFPEEGAQDPSYMDRSLTYNQAIEEARKRRAAEGQR